MGSTSLLSKYLLVTTTIPSKESATETATIANKKIRGEAGAPLFTAAMTIWDRVS